MTSCIVQIYCICIITLIKYCANFSCLFPLMDCDFIWDDKPKTDWNHFFCCFYCTATYICFELFNGKVKAVLDPFTKASWDTDILTTHAVQFLIYAHMLHICCIIPHIMFQILEFLLWFHRRTILVSQIIF